MSYRCPAVSAIVPEFSVGAWSVQLSMMSWPFTHSRTPSSETVTFHTVSDDGVRLWVNGQLIIDNWTDHAPTENSGTIALTAGQRYDIRMDFYENGGGAVAQLYWSSPTITRHIIPQSQLYPPGSSGTTVTFTSLGAEDGYVLESSENSNVGGSS